MTLQRGSTCLSALCILFALSLAPDLANANVCELGAPPDSPAFSCQDSIEDSLDTLAGGTFHGNLFSATSNATLYDEERKQYSAFTFPDRVRPSFIAEVHKEADVQAVVLYAKQCNYSVSVRSGGHSYIGMSSCDSAESQCVQINVRNMKSATVDGKLLTVGSGIILEEFADVLAENDLFVSTGECAKVGVGGHVQTGGFGMWSRHFGPAAHNVDSFRIVLADGSIRSVTKPTDATSQINDDIFFAVLGGASGSFGVVTEYTFRTVSNSDYYSVWWKAQFVWEVEGAASLWRKWMELGNLPQYKDDLRWSVHITGVGIAPTGMGPNYFEFQGSWVAPIAEADDYDPTFFQRILDACTNCVMLPGGVVNVSEPLSTSLQQRSIVARENNGAEFPEPFQHYAKLGRQTNFLPSPDQAEALVRTVDTLMPKPNSSHLYITQQSTGCSHGSKANGDAIALPFPDQAFCVLSDVFFPSPLLQSVYQPLNDGVGAQLTQALGGDTHDMFWHAGTGSVPDLRVAADRARLYESEAKFQRLSAIKHCIDPDDRFHNLLSMPLGPDADECTLGSHNCAASAECINTLGAFECVCRQGFAGDGPTCADVDECETERDNCHESASCTNTAGSFTCMCDAGFTSSDNGVTCSGLPTLRVSTTLEGMTLSAFEAGEGVFRTQIAMLLPGKAASDVMVTGRSETMRRRMLLAAGVKVDFEVGGFGSQDEVQAAAEALERSKLELLEALQADANFETLTGLSHTFAGVTVDLDEDSGVSAAAHHCIITAWLPALLVAFFTVAQDRG
eukprot:CAMPEP_0196724318 /NCGR_PEP_ID=MMETSP1091-20130531/6213_1 /TAXON_ID=302021 /ORGANISM="Rhodomonas sp., Strain CCMP768" /LENGTH=790 /DNA_ID=CAMNT_0042066423 /DNA_START=28 /DNA_END=2400 /DNA_ORIENTATION=+